MGTGRQTSWEVGCIADIVHGFSYFLVFQKSPDLEGTLLGENALLYFLMVETALYTN